MKRCLPTFNGRRFNSLAELTDYLKSVKPASLLSTVNQEFSGSPFTVEEELNIFSMMNIVYTEMLDAAANLSKVYSEFQIRSGVVRTIANHMKDNITSYSPDQQKLVYSALKEIRDNDAFWQLFKIQIGDKYGIYIREDAVNSIEDFYLNKDWDDTSQDKVSPILTANDEIKRLVNKTKILDSTKYTIDDKGNKVYQLGLNTPTGFPDTLSWRQHGNDLFNIMSGTKSKEDMLNRLYDYATFGNTPFAKTMFSIYEELAKDENLLSAWYTVFDKAIFDSYRDLTRETELGKEIDIDVSNKQKVEYTLANNWLNTLITAAENNYFTKTKLEDWERRFRDLKKKSAGFTLLSDETAQEITDLASELGITFSPSAILYINAKEGTKSVISKIITPITRIKGVDDNSKKTAFLDQVLINPNIRFNEYNNLYRLAKNVSLFAEGFSNYSNTNVKGNLIYDPQNYGFLTTFFKKIKGNPLDAYDSLIDYTKVLSNQHSLLLWGDHYRNGNKSEKPITTGSGLFDYYLDENGLRTPLKREDAINTNNLAKFNLIKYEGSKDLNQNIAKEYSELAKHDWTLKTLLYFFYHKPTDEGTPTHSYYPLISPSDRGNTMFIQMPRVPITDEEAALIALYDSSPKMLDAIKQTKVFKTVWNTVADELAAMIEAKRVIFELDENDHIVLEGGKPKVKKEILDGTIPTQLFYHYNFDENGNKDYTLGNVFKFYNLVYDDGTNKFTLNDYDFFDENNKPITILDQLLQSRSVKDFLYTPLARRRKDKSKESAPKAGNFNDLLNTFVASYLNNTFRNANNKLAQYESHITSSFVKSSTINESSPILGKDVPYVKGILEFAINTYLANIEQYRMFHGSLADYKSRIDANKRAGQILANGLSNTLTGSFYATTISDIKLKSRVYTEIVRTTASQLFADGSIEQSLIFNSNGEIHEKVLERLSKVDNYSNLKNDTEKTIYEITKPYLENDSANATSLITFEEFEKRVKGFGKYTQYKDVIDKIKNGNDLSRDDFARFATLQKNFYYDYRYNEQLKKFVPNQVKNAEVVLTPSLVKNLELERLLKAMKKAGISQINLESAEKVGTFSIADIANSNGNLVNNQDLISLLNSNRREYFYENLRMQLEVPDHIIDETNKLGVQIAKKILDNINDTATYNLNGLKLTGLDLKEYYFELISDNIGDSVRDVLLEFGVLTNDNGSLKNEIDTSILSEQLIKTAIERGLSKNTIYSLKLAEDNNLNLTLDFGTNSVTWQNLLTSIFTNRVTSQRFPGIHAAQMANLFMKQEGSLGKASEHLQKHFEEQEGIEWHSSIYNDPNRKDLKLKSRILNSEGDQTVIEAEVLLPRWSKLFWDKNGKPIDINSIDDSVRRMIGYRIPTESKYSTYIFKVVGFLPDTSGATIVLPDDFVSQTGADFDIDSVYTMQQNLTKVDDKIQVVEYIDFVQKLDTRLDATLRNRKHLLSILTTIVKDVDELHKIMGTLNQMTIDLINFKEFGNKPEVISANKRIKDLLQNKKEATKKERIEIESEILELQSTLFNNSDFTDFYNKSDEYKEFIKDLKTRIKNHYTKYNKSISYQNSKEARQNRIFDIYWSILNNPVHYIESIVGATFADVSKSKNFVNDLRKTPNKQNIIDSFYQNKPFGKTDKELIDNLTFYGQQRLRELAMAGRELKGITVAMNGFISIAQASNMYINPAQAPEVIWRFKNDDELKYLRNNFEVIGVTNDLAKIKLTKLGNNNKGSFTNIIGKKITSYFAQIPTNVLDNVKDPLPDNVNTYTIGVWSLLPMIGGDLNTATLFVNQPIIKDMVDFNNANLYTNFKGREFEQTKVKYQTLLYRLLNKIDPSVKVTGWDKSIEKGEYIFITSNPFKQKEFYKILGYQNNTSVPLFIDTLAQDIDDINMNELNTLFKINSSELTDVNKNRIKELSNKIRRQLELLETYNNYNNIALEISGLSNILNTDRLGAGPTFETSRKLIANTISFGAPVTETAHNTILINNERAVTEIYPKFFGKKVDSAYPPLQQYLYSSNLTSLAAFSSFFIDQTSVYIQLKEQLHQMLGRSEYDSKLSNLFIKYANTSLLADNKWLNDITSIEKNRLLGKDVNGEKLPITLDFNYDNLDFFNELSLANQILLIKNRNASTKPNIFLDHLELQTEKQDFDRNGMYNIIYLNNDFSDNMTRAFNELWYSDDVYERLLARNLVKFEYLTNGFSYGFTSFAKIIPTNIFVKSPVSFNNELHSEEGIGVRETLFSKLRSAQSFIIESDTDFKDAINILFNVPIFDRFMRSNWQDDSIIPDASSIVEPNTKSRTFKVENGIISLPIEKIINGKNRTWNQVKNSSYIKLRHETKDHNETYIIYKRINDYVKITQDENDNDIYTGTVYYHPVAKLNKGEHSEFSIFDFNNKLPNGDNIKPDIEYLTAIASLREKHKFTEKIYYQEIAMNMTNKDGKFRDELSEYSTTIELIRAGKRTATTKNLSTSEGTKWQNIKVGTIIKIENSDDYIRTTSAPYKVDLSGKNKREAWSKLEGWDQTYIYDNKLEQQAEEGKLIQFQYEYLGNWEQVSNTLGIENNLDGDPQLQFVSLTSDIVSDIAQNNEDSFNLLNKCK